MKRILSLSIIALLICFSQAHAVTTATFGDYNSSNAYRMSADSSGVITFAQDTGIVFPYLTATTNLTLTAAQTGTTLIFTGTSNNTRFTLPTATVGSVYQVTSSVAKSMQITPQSTDTIAYASLTIGQGLVNSSAAVGDGIELICYAANLWAVKNITGTWTHTNANP